MDIDAYQLCKNANTLLINEEIRSILRNIQDVIMDEHAKHKSEVIYELPVIFTVEIMKLKDVQLIIYGQVVEQLVEKGFKVSIEYFKNVTKLNIKWTPNLDEKTRQKYSNLLKRYNVKNNGLNFNINNQDDE